MNLINRDEILEWINTVELTPDGGVDANVLIEKLKEMPVLMRGCEYAVARKMLDRLAKKMEEAILKGEM